MQAQAYEGYFEQGNFFTAGKKLRIPEHRRVYITILEEPAKAYTQIKTKEKTKEKTRESMFGYLRGEYKISDDFDAPLEDFMEYME